MTNERPATAWGRGRPEDAAMELDPDIRQFVRAVTEAAASQPRTESTPWPEARRWAEDARARWRQGGPAMLETRELCVPTRHGPVRARIYRPGHGNLPALVYLHGGGWTLFSIDTHDRVMREYAARAGCCVVGVDYALSPEHKFPVPLEQVVDVVGWLAGEGRALGIDAARIAIGGDSAGANLSVATSLVRRDNGAGPPLCGMLLNYGAFVTQSSAEACRRYGGPQYMLSCEEMDEYWQNYLRDERDALDPLACPLLASLAGLPPAFLVIAECDILAEQSINMARRLLGAGVPAESAVYAGASHSFLEAMSIAAVSNKALDDASRWLGLVFRRHGLNAMV
jgi:acetyl esterase